MTTRHSCNFFLLPLISNSILVLLTLLKLWSMIQKTIFLGNWHQVKMFTKIVNSRMNCPCFTTFIKAWRMQVVLNLEELVKNQVLKCIICYMPILGIIGSQIKIKHIFNIKWVLTSIQRWNLEIKNITSFFMILKNWLDDGRVNYATKGDFSIKKLISLMIMCLCLIQQGDWMMGRWNDFISIFIFNII